MFGNVACFDDTEFLELLSERRRSRKSWVECRREHWAPQRNILDTLPHIREVCERNGKAAVRRFARRLAGAGLYRRYPRHLRISLEQRPSVTARIRSGIA